MSETPLHFKTITELAELIESKQLSPVEITDVMLDRIRERDPRYKSYATVMAEQERGREMVDRRHPILSTVRQCALLSISRSSVYYRPRGHSHHPGEPRLGPQSHGRRVSSDSSSIQTDL